MSSNDTSDTQASFHYGKTEAGTGSKAASSLGTSSHDVAILYDGFVPNLMKVCESLTQSSTPHNETINKFEEDRERRVSNTNLAVAAFQQGCSGDLEHHHEHPQPLTGKDELLSSISTSNSGTCSTLNRKRVRVDIEHHQQLQPKNIPWSENVHRDFVGAIFDIGMKNSSPSTILDQMVRCSEEITSERIKSHLQKYRLNKEKSKKEYMHSYDAALAKFKACGVPPDAPRNLTAGAVAAYLTYASTGIVVGDASTQLNTSVSNEQNPPFKNDNKDDKNSSIEICRNALILPTLTEEERKSPLGSALGYILGLLFAFRQQLLHQRRMNSDVSLAQRQKNRELLPSTQQHDKEGSTVPATSSAGENSYYSCGESIGNIDSALLDKSNTVGAVAGYSVNSMQQHQHKRSMSNANNSSLEESQKMKLEMREQIAVQNKMRALKRKEIEKYQPLDEEGDDQDTSIAIPTHVPSSMLTAIEPYPYPIQITAETEGDATNAGEMSQQRPRAQSESLPLSYEDFWSVDMVDEQLFEFLMGTGDS